MIREKPFLYFANGEYRVFVPALRQNSTGTSWFGKTPAGTSKSLADFFIVRSGTSAATINAALAQGKDLLVAPGTHHVNQTINVTRPEHRDPGPRPGHVRRGQRRHPAEGRGRRRREGGRHHVRRRCDELAVADGGRRAGSSANNAANPISLHDVFFRIGGPGVGRATNTLIINSNNVIGDHMWLWRADHGAGVGLVGQHGRHRAWSSTATT